MKDYWKKDNYDLNHSVKFNNYELFSYFKTPSVLTSYDFLKIAWLKNE